MRPSIFDRVDIQYYTFPFPPSVNTVYTVMRNRKILSKKGREYKTKVKNLLESPESCHMGPIITQYTFYRGDRRKYDISNFVKTVEDCLTEAKIWGDDSQVVEVHIYKGPIDKENPRVEVKVEFYE